jgi:diaminobutyrate-2-oxoglutarate transaminase
LDSTATNLQRSTDASASFFGRSATVTNILERFESVVQNSVRAAPIVFDKASGSELFDEGGKRYIDFYSGGGSQGFGHNNLKVCSALIDYLCNDRVIQTCDRKSVAKRNFVEAFVTKVLAPRNLSHKLLFTDPASGVATEVALRLARRHKKRNGIIAFTNSSHGLTEASLSVSSSSQARGDLPDFRVNTVFMPYCSYLGEHVDTVAYLRRYLEDSSSGLDLPVAIIVETTQIHGGVNVASEAWLKALESLCREFGILLIVDETHTGFGRAGAHFSFEAAGLNPDMILVSNAVASGLPISILLLKPELDHWRPGDQVGLFQGDNLAFVAATEVLSQWNESLVRDIAERSKLLAAELLSIPTRFPNRHLRVRGKGLNWGLEFGQPAAATVVSGWALERGLIVEPARLKDDVLLVLPPITISEETLREGLELLNQAVSMFLSHE